jgi:hypothetical protein
MHERLGEELEKLRNRCESQVERGEITAISLVFSLVVYNVICKTILPMNWTATEVPFDS